MAAVSVSQYPTHSKMTKVMELKWYMLMESVDKGEIETVWCKSIENTSDVQTKNGRPDIFRRNILKQHGMVKLHIPPNFN